MKRRMGVLVAVALAMPLVWTSTAEADGEPVPGFGVNGVMIDSSWSDGKEVVVDDVVDLPNGSIVVTGVLSEGVVQPSLPFVARYLPTGLLDAEFGDHGILRLPAVDLGPFFEERRPSRIAPLPDGRLLAVGLPRNLIAPDGTLQPNFSFSADDTFVRRPDGGLFVAGTYFSPPQLPLARLITPNGKVDNNFGRNSDVQSLMTGGSRYGGIPNAYYWAPNGTLLSDGRLAVTFSYVTAANVQVCGLVTLESDGHSDPTFGVNGLATTGAMQRCRVDHFVDDEIRVRGDTTDPVVGVSADGVVLGPLADPFDNPDLQFEGTGHIYSQTSPNSITAYDAYGNVDTGFGSNGVASAPGVAIDKFRLLGSGEILGWGHPMGSANALALVKIHASFGTAPQPPAVDTSKFVPVPPKRILDTRQGLGVPNAKVGVGGQVDLQIAGAGGVPTADISAVVLNVTATNATQPGYVTAYPSGGRRPNASNVNLDAAGQTAANLVTVKVGSNGKVTLFSSGGTDLVADVAGYYTPVLTSTAGRLQTAVPQRILDTREGLGAPKTKPGAGAQLDVQVTGVGPVPAAGVSAVVLNVTADQATADGYVTVWPTGTDRPEVSNLNLVAGETRPNLVIVPVGAGGKVSLFTQSGAELITDVAGWFTDATSPDDSVGLFVPITPTRMLDTRQEPIAPTASSSTVTRLIGSTTVVPPDATVAVSANITATQATGAGFITAWPANATRPVVSNLNTGHAGQTIPNAAIVPLGNDQLGLYTQTGAQLIVDINGWYTNF